MADNSSNNKACPHCKKEINVKAKKCPYCQSDLRSWFLRHPFITIVLVIIVVPIIISAANPSRNTSENSGATTTTNTKLTAEQIAQQEAKNRAEKGDPSLPRIEDGDYVIGTDIQPGTYRTRVASSGCYYARLSGFGGTLDEIITNENTNSPAVITIESTDKGFESSGCGTWTQDISAITESKTSFGDGTYIIGTDTEAGTYKNSGGSGCYYARLSGFGGILDDIITNDNTDSTAIITIASTDKGFHSSGCGTWTKQ